MNITEYDHCRQLEHDYLEEKGIRYHLHTPIASSRELSKISVIK